MKIKSDIFFSLKGGDLAILRAIEAAILFFPLLLFLIFSNSYITGEGT